MSDMPLKTIEKPYRLERVPGGQLPDLGKLFNATLGDVIDNLAGYGLAGLGQFVVMMPVMIVLIFVIYFGIFTFMFGGAMISGVVGALVAQALGDDAGGAATSIGFLGTFGGMFLMIFALIGGVTAILAPLSASLYREIAAHQRGEGKLEFASAFRSAMIDVPSVVITMLLVTGLSLVGMFFCYVPGFFVSFGAMLAMGLVALHRRGPIDAIRLSFSHAMASPGWHVPFWLILLLGGMVAGYVPIIGPMFLMALHVRAHREMFGDGPEPVLTVGGAV